MSLPLLIFSILSFLHLATSQTTPFTCPADYQPLNPCTAGPCRCAIFQVLQIQTLPNAQDKLNTYVSINVTNLCNSSYGAVYYVQFSLLDESTGKQLTVVPTPQQNTQYQYHYTWRVSVYNGVGVTTPGNVWLSFAPQQSPLNDMTSNTQGFYQWEVFQFYVSGYYPTFQWYMQMHQGANWDTFGPLDMSLCACGNCDSGWVQRIIKPCTLGYPEAPATTGRAGSAFNEDIIMYSYAISGNLLQYWYSDEHALTLGISQVVLIDGSTIDFPITATPSSPTCVTSSELQFGSTNFDSHNPYGAVDSNGQSNGCIDSATIPCGRPIPPVLFITDITSQNDSKRGDWQYNGTAYLPTKLCGTWKSASKVLYDSSVAPYFTYDLLLENDPTSNRNDARTGWVLGQNADPLPVNFITPGASIDNFGAEAAWDLDQLNLDPASTYRFQFMVHDGDQNQQGGDVGQGCIIATSACPPGFAGTLCNACDTDPAPGDGTWTWYCLLLDNYGDYQLIKIPVSKELDPFYAGGFVPGPGVLDQAGFKITCDCKRITFNCPQFCCGNGACFLQNGTCNCSGPAGSFNSSTCCLFPVTPTPTPTPISPGPTPPVAITPTPSPTPTPTPPPCFNNGVYCNANGNCNRQTDTCVCTPPWSGPFCNQTVLSPPPQLTCQTVGRTTFGCQQCISISLSVQLQCAWCQNGTISSRNVTGYCTGNDQCTTNYSFAVCPSVTNYIPPVCPDGCAGHGKCVNSSDPDYQAARIQQEASLASLKNGSSLCLCTAPYTGINCGQYPPSNDQTIGVAAGIGTAVIVGIVIAVVFCACLGGGGAYAQSSGAFDDASAVIFNNPVFQDKGMSGENPLHKAGADGDKK